MAIHKDSYLSFSANTSSTLTNILIESFLLHFLLCLDSLGFVFGSFDGLITLSLSHLWFHVSFCQYCFQRSTLDGSLKLHSSPRPLLGDLFSGTFLVLLTVKNSPRDLPWISFHQKGSFTFLA